MCETVADEIAAMLATAGVQRVYGRAGSALSSLSEALQREPALHCIGLQHEESAAFAAVGEAMLTGRPAVCCGSCGGGNMQLINGLYEAGRAAVPLLALAPHVPVSAIGSRYFQECHPTAALRDSSVYCEAVYTPIQAPGVVAAALRAACAAPGAGVTVLSADVVDMPAAVVPTRVFASTGGQLSVVEPDQEDVVRLAELINGCDKVAFLCGHGCAGARDLLVELARRIGAPIAYTLRAKDFMERDNPCAVGMVGLLGWGDAPAAIQVADLLVMWGTDFPYSCFLPRNGRVVQVDSSAKALGRRVALTHGVHGDAGRTAARLLPLVRSSGRGEEFLSRSLMRHGRAVMAMESALRVVDERAPIRPEYLTRLVSSHAEPDAVFAIDIGPPVIWAARYLQAFGHRRIIGSFNFGTAGMALPLAIGAKSAAPSRQVIALCHAGTPGSPSTELLTLLRERLSVKVLVYNYAPAQARVVQTGDRAAQPLAEIAACAAALGLPVQRLSRVEDAAPAVRRWLAEQGPAVLDVALDAHALAAPPQSDLQRTLDYMGDTISAAAYSELAVIRRMLFGNSRLYGPRL